MTFLRRYEQFVHTPKTHVVEPPRDFAERAYHAGLERGSAAVRTFREDGYWQATIGGKVAGVAIRLWAVGADENAALEMLLKKLEGLKRGEVFGTGFDL